MSVITPLLACLHFVHFETKIISVFSWEISVNTRENNTIPVRQETNARFLVQVSIKSQNERKSKRKLLWAEKSAAKWRSRIYIYIYTYLNIYIYTECERWFWLKIASWNVTALRTRFWATETRIRPQSQTLSGRACWMFFSSKIGWQITFW